MARREREGGGARGRGKDVNYSAEELEGCGVELLVRIFPFPVPLAPSRALSAQRAMHPRRNCIRCIPSPQFLAADAPSLACVPLERPAGRTCRSRGRREIARASYFRRGRPAGSVSGGDTSSLVGRIAARRNEITYSPVAAVVAATIRCARRSATS